MKRRSNTPPKQPILRRLVFKIIFYILLPIALGVALMKRYIKKRGISKLHTTVPGKEDKRSGVSGFAQQKGEINFVREKTDKTTGQPAAQKLTIKQRVQAKTSGIKALPWQIVTVLAILLLLLSNLTSNSVLEAFSLEKDTWNENQITMYFVGDVMLGRGIKDLGETSGYERLFSNMSSFWSNADLVFANLESAVLKEDISVYSQADKNIHLWASYDGVESAMEAGINVFACANNSSFGYGRKALEQLIDYFQKKDIVYSGIGETLDDTAAYEIIECNGVKIAFLSITDVFYRHSMATESESGILTTEYPDYNLLVYQAAQEADVTVVYVHWGEENKPMANEEQISLGHQFVDAGADIVIGSHPHIVQEVELYKDGIIFYSLGNFIFDQGNTYARDSVIVEYTADEDGNGAFRLYPVRINDGTPSVTTNWFYKTRINRKLTRKLAQDSYYLDENEFIVIPYSFTVVSDKKV